MLRRNLLICAFLSPLLMGASPVDKPKFVAHAETLSPAPIPATTTQPIVKTEVIPYSSPKVAQNEAPAPVQATTGGNRYPYGQCTWWVYNQTGRGQNGNAGTWGATSSVPRVGAIMIYRPGQYGAGSAGHVGVVVSVNGNQITVSSMNWSGVGRAVTHVSPSTGLFF